MTTDRRNPDGTFGGNDDGAEQVFANLESFSAADTAVESEAPSLPSHSKPHHDIKRSAEVWVAFDESALPGFGRIMLSRPPTAADTGPSQSNTEWHSGSTCDGQLSSGDPRLIRNIAVASGVAANDNVVWVGAQDGNDFGGVYGRDPSVGSLPGGDTLVAWVGLDNIVHAKLYPGPAAGDDGADAPDTATQKLNATLIELGAAGAEHVSTLNRVKVAADDNRGLAAVWTTKFGLASVLMGKILIASAAAGEAAAVVYDNESHSTYDIAPMPVAKFNGNFSVGQSSGGGFDIGYQVVEGRTARDVVVSVSIDGQGEAVLAGSHDTDILSAADEADGNSATSGSRYTDHSTAAEVVTYHAAEMSSAADVQQPGVEPDKRDESVFVVSEDVALDVAGLTAHDSFAVAGTATDTVVQTDPVVVVTAGGKPLVLSVSLGAEPGVGTIIVSELKSTGAPVKVTDRALISDPDNPEANVNAALTAVDEGFAVAWVEAAGGGDHHGKELRAQIYNDDGEAMSDEPVVVFTSDDPQATYSDLAITSSTRCGDQTSGSDAASTGSIYVVVASVLNEDEDGYGAIMAQVFSVQDETNECQGGLVAVGRDGVDDNENDSSFQLSVNGADVIGRAPQLAGLDDGSIAVAWVQETAPGSGVGVVQGVVFSPTHTERSFDLDLTVLMPLGVAEGTDPVLLDTSDGDIIVSWLQTAMSGGFEAAAAIFRAAGLGHWTRPDSAVVLSHFDELPKDFAITVIGGDDPSLVVTWRDDDSSVYGSVYDIDSGQAGDTFGVHHEAGGGSNDATGLGVAALDDGSFIVVYADSDGTDVDIRARVYETDDAASKGPGSSSSQESDGNSVPGGGSNDQRVDVAITIEFDLASDTILLTPGTGLIYFDGGGDSPSTDDVAYTLSSFADQPPCTSGSDAQVSGKDDPSGVPDGVDDASRGRGSGDGTEVACNDNLAFYNGYGNDAADFVPDENLPADLPDPITTLFEALQFANALNEIANEEVLTFDASNIVTLRPINSLTGTPEYFDIS